MNIAEKLQIIAENQQKVYEAGKAEGGDTEASYNEGFDAGTQTENKRFWDSIFQDGKRTNFAYAFAGDTLVREMESLPYIIRPVDTSATTRSANNMFMWFNRNRILGGNYDMTEVCKKLDLSQTISVQGMFAASYVDNITLDLSNVQNARELFSRADSGYVNNITLTVTDKCTNYTGTFNYGSTITHLIFTDGSVIAANISFDRCNSLDDESIQSIINALQDRIGLSALTVTLHADIKSKLTEEQTSQIAAKNWNIG